MVGRLNLVVGNTCKATTFRRPGCCETTPDITLVSEKIASKVKDWRVLEEFTGSDHQYISYTFGGENTDGQVIRRQNLSTRKWNVAKLDTKKLIARIDRYLVNPSRTESVPQAVEETMRCITESCNASMPKYRGSGRRKAVHWWSAEIAELRRTCLKARRKFTRARKAGQAISEQLLYKKAKMDLKLAIERSKRRKLEELREDLNQNPWGLGYKIVMQKLIHKTASEPMEVRTADRIVDTLFPYHGDFEHETERTHEAPPPFTKDELLNAARSFKRNKAPGPDGIPAEVMQCIAEERPDLLLNMFNLCWRFGLFPDIWKKQKLVLIEKGKGIPTQPSAYRPLCMLDVTGKLFEKLIKIRLLDDVEKAGGLSERQFGFRRGKSTLGALEDVIQSIEQAQQGNNYAKKIVLLATLDVRNAFNSLQWKDLITTLRIRFKIPSYLLNIISSYLSNRILLYDTKSGLMERKITSGAAQGSILGPDLWNITYDEILRLEMPEDCHLVGYADDVAAVIVAKNVDESRRKLNMIMIRCKTWLEQHGLRLAKEKTELIMMTKKHIALETHFNVLGMSIATTNMLKYLGVRFDSRFKFTHQINYAAHKAGRIVGMLSRLMANIGGPTQLKRRLLLETTNSVLLYGSEVWGKYLKAQKSQKILLAVQRTAALRIASAYRTVSHEAICIISSTIPIDCLIEERVRMWAARKEGNEVNENQARRETLEKLQTKWSTSVKGRWTVRLIPRINKWYDREEGEVNYYMTQMLSGHGYFRKYLFVIGKSQSRACVYGDADVDDAEHTFFHCVRWQREKLKLEDLVGTITVENIVDKMLYSKENWQMVAKYAENILKRKKMDLDSGLQVIA